MFYPNRCTDILATCDGGLIKTIQMKFRARVEGMLESYYDQLTSSDTLSRKIQRDLIMSTMNEAIEEITTENVRKVARRCGALFDLNDSLAEQYSGVKLRGFTVKGAEEVKIDGDFKYRNVFEGEGTETSVELRKKWELKESERVRRALGGKSKPKKRKKRGGNRKPKKKQKRKSKKVKKPRKKRQEKSKNVGSVLDSMEEQMNQEEKVALVSPVRDDLDEVKVGASPSLGSRPKGGQIAFTNRKNKTLSLLASLDK